MNNLGSLFEYKKNKENLRSVNENQLMQLSKWQLLGAKLVGAFIFKWLIYLLAAVITGSFLLIILSLILVTLRVYILFHSLNEIQDSKLDWYVLVAETLYVAGFMLYYFGFMLPA
ncbi:hypothetical protein E4663_01630 [Halobacillus salinus]|uniref:Uncharacterized protein n=2 Tax=Halobacillus salinus TaxID=192814 RepID=A0A4Z0H2U6_9BACI|nr:hypothetical protein E4663_01630 [Halobacillus salinus]